jgi:hypothetical protein
MATGESFACCGVYGEVNPTITAGEELTVVIAGLARA